MKKLFLYILLLAICIQGNTQKYEIYYKGNKAVRKTGHIIDGEKSGLWETYNKQGDLLSSCHYKDGLKEGLWKRYQNNASLIEEGEYLQGEKTGHWKNYFFDFLASEGKFIGGKKTGLWKYYTNNKLKREENYIEGLLDGPYITHFKIISTGQYSKGEKVGIWEYGAKSGNKKRIEDYSIKDQIRITFFFPTGDTSYFFLIKNKIVTTSKKFNLSNSLSAEFVVKSDSIIGKEFFSNGNLKQTKNISNNKTTGIATSKKFFENGNLSETGQSYFTNNRKNISKSQYWFNPIAPTLSSTYVESVISKYDEKPYQILIGDWKFYYESSELKELRIYTEHSGNYETTSYYKNGNILAIGKVDNGNYRYGKWSLYHANGKLSEIRYYNNLKKGIENVKSLFENNWTLEQFHDNGNLRLKGEYHDYNKNGVWNYYYSNNRIKASGIFLDGKKIFEWKNFYKNGKLKSIGNYIDGNKEGEWIYYFENGIIEEIGVYKHNRKINEWILNYENGNFQQSTYWEKSQGKILACLNSKGDTLAKNHPIEPTEITYTYFINGKIKTQKKPTNYKGGYTYEQKVFYNNGNLKEVESRDKNGKTEWLFYSIEGDLIQSRKSIQSGYYLLFAKGKNGEILDLGTTVDGRGISNIYDLEGNLIKQIFL